MLLYRGNMVNTNQDNKETAKKKSLVEKIFEWICFALFVLLIPHAFKASFEFGGVAVFVSGPVTRLRFSLPCILYLGALFRNLQTISG